MTELERAQQAKEMLKDIELRLNELDNMVALESIDNLRDYLDSIIDKHTPLTDEERKELIDNGIVIRLFCGAPLSCYYLDWVCVLEVEDYNILGYGKTQTEAEKDAYNQWKEAHK